MPCLCIVWANPRDHHEWANLLNGLQAFLCGLAASSFMFLSVSSQSQSFDRNHDFTDACLKMFYCYWSSRHRVPDELTISSTISGTSAPFGSLMAYIHRTDVHYTSMYLCCTSTRSEALLSSAGIEDPTELPVALSDQPRPPPVCTSFQLNVDWASKHGLLIPSFLNWSSSENNISTLDCSLNERYYFFLQTNE